MFNIAIVNNIERSKSEYITALKEKKCSIHQLELTELEERINEMDAVIITESAVENVGLTCEVIIKIRSLSNCFIWILSEESTKINRVIHLQFGADATFDSKTDAYEFCLYTIKTLERRSSRLALQGINKLANQSSTNEEKTSEMKLIPTNYSIKIKGKGEIGLTKLEFKTLELLIDRKGEAISYEELYKNAWGEEKGDRKYRVANLVFHLRKKLEDNSFQPRYIRTVRSKGYMLFS